MLYFFFKQKTAYEMRISDWSSDVCSSDLDESDVELALQRRAQQGGSVGAHRPGFVAGVEALDRGPERFDQPGIAFDQQRFAGAARQRFKAERAAAREQVQHPRPGQRRLERTSVV